MVAGAVEPFVVNWAQGVFVDRVEEVSRSQSGSVQRIQREVAPAFPKVSRKIPEYIDKLQSFAEADAALDERLRIGLRIWLEMQKADLCPEFTHGCCH